MKHLSILLAAIVAAGVVVTAGSGQSGTAGHTSRARPFHLTKECGEYTGAVGSFCTITSSNVGTIQPGMKVVYLQAMAADGSLDSDIVLEGSPYGMAVGHVVLDGTTMRVTISGGSGVFAGVLVQATVSVDKKGIWHWDGTYSRVGCDAAAAADG
jgi:hypothetical protein